MAFKRILEGATELKELITYEDETKQSVGKGKAGQVLKTDGSNTYWGEGGSGEIIKDVETVSSGGNPFVWNLETGERSEKIYLNTTLSYDEILAILKQIDYVPVPNVGIDAYSVGGVPILGDSIWMAKEYFDEANFRYVISGSSYLWTSHDDNGNENRTNNGWIFNPEHAPDGYLELTDELSGVLPESMPSDVTSMGFTDEFVGTQNDKLSRLISSTTDFGGLQLEEDQLYRIPKDDTYRLVHAKNGVAFEVANEDDVSELDKRVEALEGGSETPIWQPSTGTFMLNAEFFTKDWYVGFPIDCEKGEYSISVADIGGGSNEIIFSTIYEGGEDVNGAYFNFWPNENVSKMEYYTTTNELIVYKLSEDSFPDIQEFHDKNGDMELSYVNTSGVSFVELVQPISINSANINDYINPKLQPINTKLNELDDGVSVNRQEVTAITQTLGGVKQDIIALEQGQSALETRVQNLESNGGGSSAITDFTGAPSFPENLIINSEWEVNEAVQQELKSIDKFIYTDSVGVTAYFTLTSRIDLSDGNKNWGYLLFTTTINHPIDGIHNCYFQCDESVTYIKYYAVKVS